MMGPKQEAQAALFYEFSLDDHVPQDHLLRSIERFVDLGDIRQYLANFYSHTGRPSIDPELLIRMLLVGYCFGIRSERRLCEEVHLNLAYRWFCRLDLSDPVPNHSSFSKNRHGRFRESALLRDLFEKTVARCISDGLVSGQRLAADARLIEADANKQNSTPKEDWDHSTIDPADAPRAVKEYLDVLDDAAFGAASEVEPKFTSHSDPASQWTAASKGPAFFSYSTNYLIDTDHSVIVYVEGTRSIRQAEVGSVRIAPMDQDQCWDGSLNATSNLTYQSWTRPAGQTAHGPAPTLNGTPRTTSISARRARLSSSSGATTPTPTVAQTAKASPSIAD